MSGVAEDQPAEEDSDDPLRDVTRGLVQAMKTHYGRGPVTAKAHLLEGDVLIVVMRDSSTTAERSMVKEGREDEARKFRLAFQEAYSTEIRGVVERTLERSVASYHSQIVFDPDVLFEIFVLDE